MARLTALEELDLSDNLLDGTLPHEWNNMSRLLTLRINRGGGTLGGPLISFGDLHRIEVLELSHNSFNGTIPDNFLNSRSKDANVRVDLSQNDFTGSIPAELADFDRLFLQLEGNKITGIPEIVCQNDDWMDGDVGSVPDRCDAILCPPRTWSPLGRASAKADSWCLACDNATFFGTATCDTSDNKRGPEADILDLLYYSTGGPWWRKPHYNWTKPSIPICFREGIRCVGSDPNSGVVEVYLNEFGLRGKVHDSIFDLPNLRLLGLSFNHVDLSLTNIGNAQKLQSLLISGTNVKSLEGIERARDTFYELHYARNGMKGTFPTELLYLGSLREIYLNENKLSSTLPSEIGLHMKSLRKIVLNKNRIVGFLPSELGRLQELVQLNVEGNLLSGLIPSSLGELEKLQDINLSQQRSLKKFTGPLFAFATNSALRRIDLSGNTLAGTIPETFLRSADKETRIYANLSSNELHGGIPESLDGFKKLDVDLSSNMITYLPKMLCDNEDWMAGMVGTVHTDEACDAILCPPGTYSSSGHQTHANEPCQKCDRQDGAPYYGARQCGGVLESAPCTVTLIDGDAVCLESTTDRSTLEILFASTWGGGWKNKTNWMTDQPICSWQGVICQGEKEDDSGVVALELDDNDLSGSIPTQLWSLPDLKRLSLQGNPDLSIVLTDIPDRKQLDTLLLRGTRVHQLEGLLRVPTLKELSVAGLSGTFPEFLLKLTDLEILDLSDNFFVGSLPLDWQSLERLREFRAGRNDFYGTLPDSLVKLKGLEVLGKLTPSRF